MHVTLEKHEITNRMWGIFDETGVFMAFCRHGFTYTGNHGHGTKW
jgi:hypothetical protein